MKRMVCALLALVMVIAGGAWAEQEDLHLLWGIEFGQDIETVQEILKNERGLDMEYSRMERRYDGLFERLNCMNIDEITILGYPVDSLIWSKTADHECVEIQFLPVKISEMNAISTDTFTNVLNALENQFGSIDFATCAVDFVMYAVNRQGFYIPEGDIYESRNFTDLDIDTLNLRTVMDTIDYITERSDIRINAGIGNVSISCETINGLGENGECCITVTFQDAAYKDILLNNGRKTYIDIGF